MSSTAAARWEPVIGLEVHVQLATATKLFCRCAARFGAPPNSLVCPVCTGQPGVLPVFNRQALLLGVRAGLMLGCTLDTLVRFDRKNYFYPDLPKGYQISQSDRPLCREGHLDFHGADGAPRRVRIVRAHLEEDSGKIIHPAGLPFSLVDLNRAGTPLLEIVSGPDLRSPEEAALYLQAMRRTLRYAGVSECDLEKGSFRCDANISLRRAGTTAFGTRAEIKNLNSFKFVSQALQAEIERQGALLDSGGRVVQETMAFDPASGLTRAMRSKEDAHDYRYFPEPDLPPFPVDACLAPESLAGLMSSLPEAPLVRRQRFQEQLGLGASEAEALVAEPELASVFEAVLASGLEQGSRLPASSVASFVLNDLLRLANERKRALGELAVTPARLAGLVRLVADGTLSVQAARLVVVSMEDRPGRSARDVAQDLDLLQVSDAGELQDLVARVLTEQHELVERYRGGRVAAFNALLGAVMKASGGKANPATVRSLLERGLARA
ncbi:MAG: Asp-tRNA(Asn)/Glu-tRNA(Gln) amidotransferase subunit GatB [Planctomycetota bacterium]